MPIYSHSRIETYNNCPLKYKFQYVDGIKRYTESIEAFLGNRCHDALEKLYKDKLRGKENSLEELLGFYKKVWDKQWHDDIKFTRKEYSAEHYHEVGLKAIQDYYKRYHPFNDGKTLGLEKNISVNLSSGNSKSYQLCGYIDRLVGINDGEYEIHDYKTAGSLPHQENLDKDKQLALYQIGVEQLWPDCKKVHLVWHYLIFDKEIRSYRTVEDLKILKEEISSKIATIEKATEKGDFRPIESALCDWCDYQDLCPKRKHLFAVKTLPENKYLKEEGVTLVNKYAKLINDFKESKDVFEVEKAELEEALIDYARKKGYDTIVGSEYQANVKTEVKSSIPKTADPNREVLDNLLRKIGLWDKVSSISSSKLAKLIKSDMLTAEQLAQIKEFLSPQEKTSVSLSKIKNKEESLS